MKLGICKVIVNKYDIEQIAKEREDISGEKPLFQVKALVEKSTNNIHLNQDESI